MLEVYLAIYFAAFGCKIGSLPMCWIQRVKSQPKIRDKRGLGIYTLILAWPLQRNPVGKESNLPTIIFFRGWAASFRGNMLNRPQFGYVFHTCSFELLATFLFLLTTTSERAMRESGVAEAVKNRARGNGRNGTSGKCRDCGHSQCLPGNSCLWFRPHDLCLHFP